MKVASSFYAIAMGCAVAACSAQLQEPEPKRTSRPVPAYAPRTVEATGEGASWLVLDVDTDNAVRYRDKIIYDRSTDDPAVLLHALQTLRKAAIDAGDVQPVAMWIAEEEHGVIREPVRILSHKWAEWAAVHELMQTCSHETLRMYAVQLALFTE